MTESVLDQDIDEIEIKVPYLYEYRDYQRKMETAVDELGRYVGVWHRRAGKDKTALNVMIAKMMERIGNYYYFLPTYKQGKKIIWEGKDRNGMKFLDHFPEDLILSKNETEMKIKLKGAGREEGSLFQIIGTDDYNSIMGTNPVGCVFSEYSLQDPRAWDYIRPILRENGGWAIFIFTPRGRNHGRDLFTMALKNPKWFAEKLTIIDTNVLTPEDIQDERDAGMSEDLVQQEFYCSFEGSIDGAYYSQQVKKAREENRITSVPHEPRIKVDTFWDLGISDYMTIWFVQQVGKEVRIIDYYENSGEGLAHYAKYLSEKPYIYGTHYMPHDARVRELGTGKSRAEVAESLGLRIEIARMLPVEDGIEAVRNIFNRCWFDKTRCERGIETLENYRKEYNDDKKCFRNSPLHDWASHGADGFRTFAVAFEEKMPKQKPKRKRKSWLAS